MDYIIFKSLWQEETDLLRGMQCFLTRLIKRPCLSIAQKKGDKIDWNEKVGTVLLMRPFIAARVTLPHGQSVTNWAPRATETHRRPTPTKLTLDEGKTSITQPKDSKMDSLDNSRLLRFRLPRISNTMLRAGGVYLAGALVSPFHLS